MNRRTALAAAGAVVLTVAAGAVAVAANLGLLQQGDTGVGQLQPVVSVTTPSAAAPTDTETIYIDEYVAPDVSGSVATIDGSVPPAPAPLAPADDLGYEEWDDDAYGEDHSEEDEDDEEDEEDEHEGGEEDEEDEYEGGEDDD